MCDMHVRTDPGETPVALHPRLIAEVVLVRPLRDVTVPDLGELVAPLSGARRHSGRPRSVRLADEHGQAGPLVSRVALVSHHSPIIQASSSQNLGSGVLYLRQRRALGS